MSRIGGFDVRWHCENDKHASRVLAEKFPGVPNHGDVMLLSEPPAVDLLVGGSPCQGFSVAGYQRGMADERSGLFTQFVRLIDEIQPEWVLWENVPGALTSNKGEDFANVIAALVGWPEPVRLPRHPNGRKARTSGVADGPRGQFAWRVLDAQYFGVPQRRKRVFGVLHIGGHRAGEVLLERKGVQRDHRTGNPAGQEDGRPAGEGAEARSNDVAVYRKSRRAASNKDYETWVPDVHSNTLNTFDDHSEVRATTVIVEPRRAFPDPAGTLTNRYYKGVNTTFDDGAVIVDPDLRVRRLTPLEAERLQGFPDNWTESAGPDSARFKACGNAVAVPCAEWVLRRLALVAEHMELERLGLAV